MTEISNPHDKFFKKVFTTRDSAAEFLRHYLPENVVGLLDLDSLEYTKDTFVDTQFKEYFSDLLFRTQLKDGSPGYVYILFEHKSYQEPLAAFHLLRYMVKIWDMLLKKREKPGFPVIIPLVVYHGRKGWKPGVNFRDLFDCPDDMAIFIPDFQYLLWDATRYRDEEIKGAVILRVALLLMKYIFRQDLNERIPGILGLLRELSEKRTGLEYVEAVLRYIVNGAPTDNIDYEDLKVAVNKALPHIGGEIMPTIADKLREQGMQEGVQKGIQQGMQQGMQKGIQKGRIQTAREAIFESLETRFEIVPRSIAKKIDEIEELSLLKILHKKSIVVDSLEQFKEMLIKLME